MSEAVVKQQEHGPRPATQRAAPPVALVPAVPNHKFGMWLFLSSEVMFFSGLLGSYLVLRLSDPAGFATQAAYLDWRPAALNTMVLIFSSLTMALSIHYAREGDRGKVKMYLVLTIVCGIIFMIVKGFEYGGKFSHGIYPSTHIFFACYFTLTAIHGLHVLGGLIPLGWLLARAGGKTDIRRQAGGLEIMGLYWHFVDLVWIFLFPLFYLLH